MARARRNAVSAVAARRGGVAQEAEIEPVRGAAVRVARDEPLGIGRGASSSRPSWARRWDRLASASASLGQLSSRVRSNRHLFGTPAEPEDEHRPGAQLQGRVGQGGGVHRHCSTPMRRHTSILTIVTVIQIDAEQDEARQRKVTIEHGPVCDAAGAPRTTGLVMTCRMPIEEVAVASTSGEQAEQELPDQGQQRDLGEKLDCGNGQQEHGALPVQRRATALHGFASGRTMPGFRTQSTSVKPFQDDRPHIRPSIGSPELPHDSDATAPRRASCRRWRRLEFRPARCPHGRRAKRESEAPRATSWRPCAGRVRRSTSPGATGIERWSKPRWSHQRYR